MKNRSEKILKFVNESNNNFVQDLRKIGVELADNVNTIIGERSIELGIGNVGNFYTSSISLYPETISLTGKIEKNRINFGSSGSFTPEDNNEYWRTIHAASILKNWNKVSELINKYCSEYYSFMEETYNNEK